MPSKATPLPFVIPTGVDGSQLPQTFRAMDYQALIRPATTISTPATLPFVI